MYVKNGRATLSPDHPEEPFDTAALRAAYSLRYGLLGLLRANGRKVAALPASSDHPE